MEDAWKVVDDVRALESPNPNDIVDADIAMMCILNHWGAEKHNKAHGYSPRFPRYQQSYTDRTPKQELEILQQHYWARERDLNNLRRLLGQKEAALQRTCIHKWEKDLTSRDHRSHYICTECGAFR